MRVTAWAVLVAAGLAGFSLAQDMPKCAVRLKTCFPSHVDGRAAN